MFLMCYYSYCCYIVFLNYARSSGVLKLSFHLFQPGVVDPESYDEAQCKELHALLFANTPELLREVCAFRVQLRRASMRKATSNNSR